MLLRQSSSNPMCVNVMEDSSFFAGNSLTISSEQTTLLIFAAIVVQKIIVIDEFFSFIKCWNQLYQIEIKTSFFIFMCLRFDWLKRFTTTRSFHSDQLRTIRSIAWLIQDSAMTCVRSIQIDLHLISSFFIRHRCFCCYRFAINVN